MENTEAKPTTTAGDPNVNEDVKVTDEVKSEEDQATGSTKWKWVWRDICFVAEAVVERDEDVSKSGAEVSIEEENTDESKVHPTSGKRKTDIDSFETIETAEKKAKLSHDLAEGVEKMEL